jgi:hypothetical protein
MRFAATCIAALAAFGATAEPAELRLSGPYTHDNLSIYLVHGRDRVEKKYLTLTEAMEQRKVVVYETSNVNLLQVENFSGQDVYIQSGEIVKGGKQDRVLKDDIIVPSASGRVNVPAFCVEHGRWTQRGHESAQSFAASPNVVASPAMKLAVKEKGEQQAVWAEAARAQDRLAASVGAPVKAAASPSSYQLTLEAPKVKEAAAAYQKEMAALAGRFPDALGYVMAVNGKVTGADVYATHELFRKLWPKLLESAAVEAVASGKPAGKVEPPPMADVRTAATGYGARISAEGQVNRRTNNLKADLPQGVVFETKDAEAPQAPVHRNYVAK